MTHHRMINPKDDSLDGKWLDNLEMTHQSHKVHAFACRYCDASREYADQRAHDVTWQTARDREDTAMHVFDPEGLEPPF